MADYTDTTKVANYLGITLTVKQTAALAMLIPAVTKWINRYLGSQFDKADPSSRYFKGNYRNISIDPCQAITAVEAINPFDNTVWYTYQTPLEYIAEPYNEDVKTYLTLRANEFTADEGLGFPGGKNNDISIKVTAKFSEYDYTNDKVPEDIVSVATIIASVWLENNSRAAGLMRENIEGHLIEQSFDDILEKDPLVSRVLESRKEIWLED